MSIDYTSNWLIILDTFDYQEEGGGGSKILGTKKLPRI